MLCLACSNEPPPTQPHAKAHSAGMSMATLGSGGAASCRPSQPSNLATGASGDMADGVACMEQTATAQACHADAHFEQQMKGT